MNYDDFGTPHESRDGMFSSLQRVDAIEAILLVQRLDGSSPDELSTAAKLHKLCIIYDDNGLKVQTALASLL